MTTRGPEGDFVSIDRRVAAGLINDYLNHRIQGTEDNLVKFRLRKLAVMPRNAEYGRSLRNGIGLWTSSETASACQHKDWL